jgi:integrase
VKVPKFDNRRNRFLSHKEAGALLDRLKGKNEQVYQMALLGLQTGMRASEIFNLTWGCIDTDRGIITILDAKSGKGRPAFMTEQIKTMFNAMSRGKNDAIVFPNKNGKAYTEISHIFRDAVVDLKLNENVSDKRQRVCFHSLRHSFGSYHAEAGTDLYVIKSLMGHGSITLTERYSHLSQGTLQASTGNLERAIEEARKKEAAGSNVVNIKS